MKIKKSNKLTCTEHGRRVLVVKNYDNVYVTLHRNDGSHCSDNEVQQLGRRFDPNDPIEVEPRSPEERLLFEIFGV